jgi:CBS domain-containing protein
MPFLVKDLIEGRGEPVTVTRDCSVKRALDLMIEHDFDQLPVVTEDKKHLGMVTNGSILRSLNCFDVKLDLLRVSDALTKVRAFREDDDLFALLNDLRERFAVPIVDGANVVVGIVTNYDTTEFFRQQSENLMMVEDIELALRQYIRTAVGAPEDEENDALRDAVAKIMPSSQELKKKYKSAVCHLLNLRGENGTPDSKHIELTFSKHLSDNKSPKEFDQLTLAEYIDLFLHEDQWHLYEPIFVLQIEAVRNLLTQVREIRNKLMHFGGELDARQRFILRFCSQWLDDHQGAIEKALLTAEEEPPDEDTTVAEGSEVQVEREEDIAPIEESSAREGKYAPLAAWLQALPAKQDKVELTFQEIETRIGDDLPPSARAHRSWWANVADSRSQSRQWLAAGWRTSRVNVTEEKVVFSRITDQKRKYIEFFGALINELRRATDLPVRQSHPDGRSWHHVARLPDEKPHPSFLAFAFARDKRLRVELYIDTGDAEKNKTIFDSLHRNKDEIEAALGEELSWERLDELRASRVALYTSASIADEDAALKRLRNWAVPTMIKFRAVLSEHLPTNV